MRQIRTIVMLLAATSLWLVGSPRPGLASPGQRLSIDTLQGNPIFAGGITATPLSADGQFFVVYELDKSTGNIVRGRTLACLDPGCATGPTEAPAGIGTSIDPGTVVDPVTGKTLFGVHGAARYKLYPRSDGGTYGTGAQVTNSDEAETSMTVAHGKIVVTYSAPWDGNPPPSNAFSLQVYVVTCTTSTSCGQPVAIPGATGGAESYDSQSGQYVHFQKRATTDALNSTWIMTAWAHPPDPNSGGPRSIYASRSSDDGQTWTTQCVIAQQAGSDDYRNPFVIHVSDSDIRVYFIDNAGLAMVRWTGGDRCTHWSAPVQIALPSPVSGASRPSLIQSGGNIYLLASYTDQTNGDGHLDIVNCGSSATDFDCDDGT